MTDSTPSEETKRQVEALAKERGYSIDLESPEPKPFNWYLWGPVITALFAFLIWRWTVKLSNGAWLEVTLAIPLGFCLLYLVYLGLLNDAAEGESYLNFHSLRLI
ncbi:MAG: hypothetical protein OSA89_20040 [Mariniblastus sp.]|nr:hypothetical protein [Mariniblastus sp.]